MSRSWEKVRRAYDFLKSREGAEVTIEEIASASAWSKGTVATYLRKRWLAAQLLVPVTSETFKVQIGTTTWEAFRRLQSQVMTVLVDKASKSFDYDVAFSFAGEDRQYVREVADVLRAYGVQLFYDVYEQHSLWGKDLYVHLDEVYRARSRYCVMFLSKHYAEKLWTNHERRAAQARAFSESSEYVLPVRLDNTEIPGVTPTTGFLDGRVLTPTDVANMITKKLGLASGIDELIEIFRDRLPEYVATQDGPNLVFNNAGEGHSVTLSILMLREALDADQLYLFTESSIFVQ
jgi:hypothetical protein